jgi:hypothetical protein
MTYEHAPSLTPSELAEAEAASDVTDVDSAAAGPGARGCAEVPARPAATDTELAYAESESDLSHSEPAR